MKAPIRLFFGSWNILILTLMIPFLSNAQDIPSLSSQLLQKALQEGSSPPSSPSKDIAEPSLPTIKTPLTQPLPAKKQKELNLPHTYGTISLDSGQQFTGDLYFPVFSIRIEQSYQGKIFIKVLDSSQIRSLRCLEWGAFPYRKDDASSTFQFVCTRYNIQSKEGENLIYEKIIPSLSQILFKNKLGTSLFYLYFVDYTKGKRWENLQLPSSQKNVNKPIDGVIRTIILGNTPAPSFSQTEKLPPALSLDIPPDISSKVTPKKGIHKTIPMPSKQQKKQPIHKKNQVPHHSLHKKDKKPSKKNIPPKNHNSNPNLSQTSIAQTSISVVKDKKHEKISIQSRR